MDYLFNKASIRFSDKFQLLVALLYDDFFFILIIFRLLYFIIQFGWAFVMFWLFDPAKNAIQGDAPEGSDTF